MTNLRALPRKQHKFREEGEKGMDGTQEPEVLLFLLEALSESPWPKRPWYEVGPPNVGGLYLIITPLSGGLYFHPLFTSSSYFL